MAESVYANRTDKFNLIVTTIAYIHEFNGHHVHHHGFEDYTNYIASADRTCGLGIERWSSIDMDAKRACNLWDNLKLLPTSSFLSLREYKPLHLKLAALRIMLDNFNTAADDTRYWKLTSDQLEIIDAVGENPVRDARRTKNPQNPTREDHIHHGNPGDPHHNQPDIYEVDAMLSQLEHYI